MAYKKESGIYQIICIKTNKSYIGQSRRLRERLYNHKYCLVKNISHHPLLQNDWNEYGEDNFTFKVLEYCENLDEREIYWVKQTQSFTNGYNTTTGGINGNIQDERQKNMRSIRFKGENNPMYGRTGELNPSSKLKDIQVIEIKTMVKNKIPDNEIISKFNMSKSQFQKIKHNRTWKHIIV